MKLLKSTSTSAYYLPSSMLRPFSEVSTQDEPVIDNGKSWPYRKVFDYNAIPENMPEACKMIGRLKFVCKIEEKMHIAISLQVKIEEIEEFIKPENISKAVWRNMSHQEKFEHLFKHYEDYDCFTRFVESVMAFNNNDPKTAAKLVDELCSEISLVVKRYAYCRLPDSVIFRDEKFQKLIESFNYSSFFLKEDMPN